MTVIDTKRIMDDVMDNVWRTAIQGALTNSIAMILRTEAEQGNRTIRMTFRVHEDAPGVYRIDTGIDWRGEKE